MLLYLVRLADVSGVDLGAAVRDKLAANAAKWVWVWVLLGSVAAAEGRGACDGAAEVCLRGGASGSMSLSLGQHVRRVCFFWGGGAVTVTGRAVLLHLPPVPAHRYPAEHCRGKADKYTAYEDAKRTHREQQQHQAVKGQEQSAATTE